MKKTSRLGKIFWSCSTYPTCTYAVWDEPVATPCPNCGWGLVSKKISKKYGEWHRCTQPECGWNDNAEAAAATAAFRARFTKGKEAKVAAKKAAKPAAKAKTSKVAAPKVVKPKVAANPKAKAKKTS
jgi:DNA topoisomerase-1